MKRAAALGLALFLTLAGAAALAMEAPLNTQAPSPAERLPLADALIGEHVWPSDGVTESCTLRYRYPQFDAWTDADQGHQSVLSGHGAGHAEPGRAGGRLHRL